MKISHLVVLTALLGSVMAFTPAHADNVDRLSLSVGSFDAFGGDNRATDFRAEYRPGTDILWKLKPWVGAEMTSEGSLYGGGGILFDYDLGSNWLLTPSIGAGLYSHGGGKKLGNTVEFREQIEIGYQFENASRITGSVSHMSNWGMGDKNPGVDVFGVYYHVPMHWLLGSDKSASEN